MVNPLDPRRMMFGAAKRFLLERADADADADASVDDPPRHTPNAIQRTRRSRSRERILTNLEDMYREGFERAKASGDQAQMTTLDFAYRREQLYFEILLDIRDAVERRG
jgi:hypothetical protein